MQTSPFLKSNSTRSMKNQIISGVEWSINIFNCSFHAFSRLLLRRSSEYSLWLKFKRKIQEYFRKSLHWSASERWWTWKSSPSWQSENSIDDDDGCVENEINENNEMRKWKWREVWIFKKNESEKLFRRLEVATETLAAHMRLMIMMPWWLSSWYLYWLGNSCNNGNILPLIVLKMMPLIIVLGNITTMRVKIITTMWIIIIIIVLLGWWYWWWWYWWRRRFDPGGWKLWRKDLRPSPMPEEASMLNPRCFFF